MNDYIKKPMRCANTSQAIYKKLQGNFTQMVRRVKLEFIRVAVWLSIAKG
jgi:hypothetical protein